MGADLVRYLEGVQRRVSGEEAAIVGGDVQVRRWLHHELLIALLETAQDGVGELAVHLDMAFAGKGEGVRGGSRGDVAEEAAEGVGQEVRQQGRFLERIGAAETDEVGPVLEFGLPTGGLLWQTERPHLLPQGFRVEERF